MAQNSEKDFIPKDNFEALIQKEKDDAWKYGGRTVKGFSKNDGNKNNE